LPSADRFKDFERTAVDACKQVMLEDRMQAALSHKVAWPTVVSAAATPLAKSLRIW